MAVAPTFLLPMGEKVSTPARMRQFDEVAG